MRLARVRMTVRGMMALVVCVSLLLAWAAYRERLRRQTYGVLIQDSAVRSAEANYRNAGLAREAAQAAIARYEGKSSGENEPPSLRELRDAAKKARQRELDLEAIWRVEKDTLSRLIREMYDSWL
jgi:hypothetical protein